jgi:hypothetical protein
MAALQQACATRLEVLVKSESTSLSYFFKANTFTFEDHTSSSIFKSKIA